ncbi:MAG: associated protein [Anaerosporomusa subterranea]|jgi:uncharacterized membrane protein YdjX (TVP38/TMEM64 family)|nr:associated protein [Anaerosporomusa subterranea]
MRYYDKTTVKPSLTSYFAGFIIIGAMFIYGFDSERFRPDTIRDMILEWGYWAPFLYILCNGIRPFFFFPAIVLGVAGGLTFGPLWGTIYLIIGTAFGAALCFGLARLLGCDRLKRSWPKWIPMEELDDQAVRHGFRTVLLLRLAPVLPWDVVSFMAGLSKVRFWPYFAATIIGSMPGAIAFSYLGDSLSQSLARAALVAGGIGVMAICLCYGKRYQHS